MTVPRIRLTLPKFLQKYAIISKVSVQWGEQDAFKHVNNVVYFKYQEAARLKYFDALMKTVAHLDPDGKALDVRAWDEGNGIGPILASTDIKFLFPVTYPDTLLVGARVDNSESTSKHFFMHHDIWSLRLNRVVASGHGTIVTFDYCTGSAVEMPQIVIDAILKLGAKDNSHLEKYFTGLEPLLFPGPLTDV